MAIFHIQTDFGHDQVTLLKRINYIREPTATCSDLIYTVYVSDRFTYEEFMLAKRCHLNFDNNTYMRRQFFEFILSLMNDESQRIEDFADCVRQLDLYIANFMGGHYQVISAIHRNTDNLHAHIIINNIDFSTGNRLQIDLSDLYQIRKEIDRILQSHYFSALVKSNS